MRTTLDIDEDVLQAAKELAAHEKTTAGKILSRFFRRGLHASHEKQDQTPRVGESSTSTLKNGVPVLRSRGGIVSTEKVREIMEDEAV
jgi:hypothetical protein